MTNTLQIEVENHQYSNEPEDVAFLVTLACRMLSVHHPLEVIKLLSSPNLHETVTLNLCELSDRDLGYFFHAIAKKLITER